MNENRYPQQPDRSEPSDRSEHSGQSQTNASPYYQPHQPAHTVPEGQSPPAFGGPSAAGDGWGVPPPFGPTGGSTAAAEHSPAMRPRAKRGVGLMVAVAMAAAVVGGGTAALVQQATADPVAGSSSATSGTQVSSSNVGTVAGVAEAVSPSIVEISANSSAGKSTGSGVIITADGEIVTNNHVISGASEITVRTSDGKTYEAEVVGEDPDKDLALIKLRDASGLKAATLGDSSEVKVGDEVVAIGSPEGLTGTVTSGVVSALDREVTVAKEDDSGSERQGQERQWDPRQGWPFEFGGQQFNGDTGESTTTYKAIQTDAPLNPGNSGGALINMNGEVIGINSAMYSPSSSNGAEGGSVGLGFAIPVNTLKADLDALRSE
ncbi:trypsin-like peptidase domain-containing protein [Streptomyces microflavus]|uniref:S1C family serine protease n=1 Tax=Streptomyces microflavus TaxID=1919 RepID=UPI00364A7E93